MIEWILINIISALFLPIFLLMILAALAGAKPDGIVKIFLDFVKDLVYLAWGIARGILSLAIRICRCVLLSLLEESKKPARKSPSKTTQSCSACANKEQDEQDEEETEG